MITVDIQYETKRTSLKSKSTLFKSKTDFIAVVTLLTAYALFNLLLINKFFPVSEGWFQDYSRYISDGAVLYKDFYLCIPPGTPILMFLLSKMFGNVFILYRLFGLAERLLLILVVYLILRKIFPAWIAFIGLFVSSCVYIANLQDVFYGYYQSSLLWAMLSIYFCIRMYESFDKPHFYNAFFFGVSVIVSFFFKQTLGLVLAFAIFIMFICGAYYRSIYKCLINFGIVLTGCIVGSIPFIAYLLYTDSFTAFIDQVFGGITAKGSVTSILFSFLTRIHPASTIVLVLLFFIYFSAVLMRKEKFSCSDRIKSIHSGLFVIENLAFAAIVCFFSMVIFYSFTNHTIFLFASLITVLSLLLAVTIYNKYSAKQFMTPLLIVSIGFFTVFTLFIISHKPISFLSLSQVINNRRYLIYAIFFILIAYSVHLLYEVLLKRNQNNTVELIIVVASWSIMYIHGFSMTIEEHSALLSFSVFIGLILNRIRLEDIGKYKPIKYTVTFGLCFFMVCCVFIQRNNLPYSWWGVGMISSTYNSSETFDDPNLKGFHADSTSVKAMNDIYHLIQNNRSGSGTDTMYTFPHINYFNVMADMDSPTFSKVQYFDVCPDEVAENDAIILMNSLPTFIVWMDFDENLWEIHEDYFRAGNVSGQRSIQNAYQRLTQSGQYECLGIFTLSDTASPIYIWHLI